MISFAEPKYIYGSVHVRAVMHGMRSVMILHAKTQRKLLSLLLEVACFIHTYLHIFFCGILFSTDKQIKLMQKSIIPIICTLSHSCVYIWKTCFFFVIFLFNFIFLERKQSILLRSMKWCKKHIWTVVARFDKLI